MSECDFAGSPLLSVSPLCTHILVSRGQHSFISFLGPGLEDPLEASSWCIQNLRRMRVSSGICLLDGCEVRTRTGPIGHTLHLFLLSSQA